MLFKWWFSIFGSPCKNILVLVRFQAGTSSGQTYQIFIILYVFVDVGVSGETWGKSDFYNVDVTGDGLTPGLGTFTTTASKQTRRR